MKDFIAIIGVILAIYLGNVIGVYSLCVETPRLNKAKKYATIIPFFLVACCVYLAVSKDEKGRKVFRSFLKCPHKSIVMAYFFAEVIAEERATRPTNGVKRVTLFNKVFDKAMDPVQLSPMLGYKWSL